MKIILALFDLPDKRIDNITNEVIVQRLVESVQVNSVADLYIQYTRYARSYDFADNPLHELTTRVPRSATYYAVVPINEALMAEAIMKSLSGRKKLRRVRAWKDEIRYSDFAPVDEMLILYA